MALKKMRWQVQFLQERPGQMASRLNQTTNLVEIQEVGATTSHLNTKANFIKKLCNGCIVCTIRIKRMEKYGL